MLTRFVLLPDGVDGDRIQFKVRARTEFEVGTRTDFVDLSDPDNHFQSKKSIWSI